MQIYYTFITTLTIDFKMEKNYKRSKLKVVPTVEEFLAFKVFKEQADPRALRIFEQFEASKNINAFNNSLLSFLREEDENKKSSSVRKVNTNNEIMNKDPPIENNFESTLKSTNHSKGGDILKDDTKIQVGKRSKKNNICSFFQSNQSCLKGIHCKFKHVTTSENNLYSNDQPERKKVIEVQSKLEEEIFSECNHSNISEILPYIEQELVCNTEIKKVLPNVPSSDLTSLVPPLPDHNSLVTTFFSDSKRLFSMLKHGENNKSSLPDADRDDIASNKNVQLNELKKIMLNTPPPLNDSADIVNSDINCTIDVVELPVNNVMAAVESGVNAGLDAEELSVAVAVAGLNLSTEETPPGLAAPSVSFQEVEQQPREANMPTKSPHRPKPFRTVHRQPGGLQVFIVVPNNQVQRRVGGQRSGDQELRMVDPAVLQTACKIAVRWILPSAICADAKKLSIGLLRYGAPLNLPCVVAKQIGSFSRNGDNRIVVPSGLNRSLDEFGNESIAGKIPFLAPRAPGRFVFRLFDEFSPETALTTLATSLDFAVMLSDAPDVYRNLKFCSDALKEQQSKMKGCEFTVNQLSAIVKGSRGVRSNMQTTSLRSNELLFRECLTLAFSLLDEGTRVLDEAKAAANKTIPVGGRYQLQNDADADVSFNEENDKIDDKDKDQEAAFWRNVKVCGKLHVSLEQCFSEISSSPAVIGLLDPILRQRLRSATSLHCPLMNRFYFTSSLRDEARLAVYGFTPFGPQQSPLSRPVLQALQQSLHELFPTLLPPADFQNKREQIRRRTMEILLAADITDASDGSPPPILVVQLFGSSCNNFGSEHSDVDMCLLLLSSTQPGRLHSVSTARRTALLEAAANALRLAGLPDVLLRPSARVPIVTFRDTESGLCCDLSLGNPLAVANTALLRAYSLCDPRLLPLAAVIKHWARRRRINSPADGTLSSYGYILCLIHYLQTRSPPVLPILQRLPPTWCGMDLSDPIPHRFVPIPVLGQVEPLLCDVYFYSTCDASQLDGIIGGGNWAADWPMRQRFAAAFGSRNRESLAHLLVGFFEYFSWHFDYKACVVSVHRPFGTGLSDGRVGGLMRMTKAEEHGWAISGRLSIEDPFEPWYDVGHVLRGPSMALIRKEFLRAFTLIHRAAQAGQVEAAETDPLSAVTPEGLLAVICEQGEEQTAVFPIGRGRERMNSVTSEISVDDE